MPEDEDISKRMQNEDSIAEDNIPNATNPTPETQSTIMEVHHHPDLHHKRKRFREYFLEFLMIFLAVTLGFFAENLREHFADSNKEKIYVNGLTRDLKADSSFINIMVDFINNDDRKLDTLMYLISSHKYL